MSLYDITMLLLIALIFVVRFVVREIELKESKKSKGPSDEGDRHE